MKLILELDDQLNSKESKAQLHQKQVKKESVRKTRFDEVPHLLDGFRMLNKAQAEYPEKVYSLDISQQNLEFVIEKDLEKFTNLHTLNASENLLPFARLGSLLSLKNLNFSCNALKSLDLDVEGKFQNLEHLELQSNTIDRSALIVLATLPNLKHLDLTRNGIKVLHNDFCNMKNWQEKVIELILPFHVSGLKEDEIEIGVPVQMDTVESNRRAFSQSSDSLASLPKAIELNLGFKALETLILNDNPLGMAFPSTFWGILSPLPQYCLLISLKRLYLNHVSLKSFKPLVSRITMDLNLESLHLDQNDIPKLDGFHKLQVLHVTNNLIAEVEDLLGFIHLPALSKIYLEANPVMTKILPRHLQPKRKKNSIDYFQLLLANFGIQIADLCYQLPVSAVGSGLVSVGIVRPLTSRKKNTVKQPFVLHSHLVSEAPADKTKDDRVQRRTYQFTDNDLQKIVKGGQIPSIKELMKQALVDEDTLPEVQQDTVDAVDLEAETDFVKDKTFLTGVGIVEEHIPSWYTNYLDEEIDAPLPLTITESVKALRIALKNPSAIWRTSQTEKSKLKAFAGFKISRNSNAPKLPVDELEEMEELMRNVDVQVHAMQNKLSQVLNKVQV